MPVDNPFEVNRLNSIQDFRPDWDVPELHKEVGEWLIETVLASPLDRLTNPHQKISVLLAGPGLGKTHLLGRLAHRLSDQSVVIFIPPMDEGESAMDHLRWHFVESLFRNVNGNGDNSLQLALAKICQESFREFYLWLPPSIRASHRQLGERLEDDLRAVLEIIGNVHTEEPFLRMADSLVKLDLFSESPSEIVKALALTWAPTRLKTLARKWLRGDSISDRECDELGLSSEPPSTTHLYSTVAALFQHEVALVVCCDQLEAVLRRQTAVESYSNALVTLLQQVPNLRLIVSCLDDRWDKFTGWTDSSFVQRCQTKTLERISKENVVDLLTRRLKTWSGARVEDPTWPLELKSWAEFAHLEQPPVRTFLDRVAGRFREWDESGRPDVRITPAGADDIEGAFRLLWTQELDRIRRDVAESPGELQESRIYSILLEAFRMQQDFKLDDYPAISEITENVLTDAKNSPRLGFAINASGTSVVIAVTKLESCQKFRHFFNETSKAVKKRNSRQCVIVHHKAELPTGNGKTRDEVNESLQARTLQATSLKDFVADFEHLQCYSQLLKQAQLGNLMCGTKTLAWEDCRQLCVKLGFLDQNRLISNCLDVFQGNETRQPPTPTPKSPQPQPKEGTRTSVDSNLALLTRTVQEVGTANAWASAKLGEAVEQLRGLKVQVEPSGFQCGPRFSRLLVRPLGRTTINQVRNRAEDLKIRMELENNPIVDSQSGGIGIDIEMPQQFKRIVSLSESLLEPPSTQQRIPLFPLGQDVVGKSHWADLSNANTCHFLIAGTTGSGKSELLISICAGLARRMTSKMLQFVLIDPKRVTFTESLSNSPYLHAPIAYTVDDAIPLLEWAFRETDRRFELLQKHQVKDLTELSSKIADPPPRLVVVCDEFANLMVDNESKAALEAPLKSLSSKARAAGIHLILATQRPENTVVTPLIRSNLPGRIALKVKSSGDSKIIIENPDACNLLGYGDLLWEKGAGLLRLQAPLTTSDELIDAFSD